MSRRGKKAAGKQGKGRKAAGRRPGLFGWLRLGGRRARRKAAEKAARKTAKKTAGKPLRPTFKPKEWPAQAGFFVLVLLAAVVASGLLAVRQADEVRQLHRNLEEARHRQDELAAEHSRLLLERSALSAYYNVERVAASDLGMRFPAQVRQLPR